jgi:hypothetical protein
LRTAVACPKIGTSCSLDLASIGWVRGLARDAIETPRMAYCRAETRQQHGGL